MRHCPRIASGANTQSRWSILLRAVPWASVFFTLLLTPPIAPLYAVMDEERPSASDPDYAAGIEAFKRDDWHGVIEAMTTVVTRRPWHDNAYNLLGYAHRKLGNYDQSLRFYFKVLDLNPHNRGALEYLGETYLALGCMEQARAMLTRLETACRRLAPEGRGEQWKQACEPWQDLHTAIATARRHKSRPCRLPTPHDAPRQ